MRPQFSDESVRVCLKEEPAGRGVCGAALTQHSRINLFICAIITTWRMHPRRRKCAAERRRRLLLLLLLGGGIP